MALKEDRVQCNMLAGADQALRKSSGRCRDAGMYDYEGATDHPMAAVNVIHQNTWALRAMTTSSNIPYCIASLQRRS
jgi:hypothetical protein